MSPRYPSGPRPGVRMPQQVDFNVRFVLFLLALQILMCIFLFFLQSPGGVPGQGLMPNNMDPSRQGKHHFLFCYLFLLFQTWKVHAFSVHPYYNLTTLFTNDNHKNYHVNATTFLPNLFSFSSSSSSTFSLSLNEGDGDFVGWQPGNLSASSCLPLSYPPPG